MSYTPPPPPPPSGPGGYGGYAAPQTNQKALWSMVLGILSLVCCGLVIGIPAIILGSSAQKEIAASGGTQTGDGMAKAGVILGWIGIAWSLIVIVLVAAGALTLPTAPRIAEGQL